MEIKKIIKGSLKRKLKRVKKTFKKMELIFKKYILFLEAFSLIELIVVITILAILWSIAFFGVSWFLKKSRDVSRFENLNRIDFWIEVFVTKSWFYPQPDNVSNITFSWATLWSQWTFWDTVRRLVWILSEKPTDLVSWNEYAYSLANDRKQYELWTVLESDDIMLNSFTNKANASWNIPVRSLVVWNYNWLSLSTSTGWLIYVLALPTILSYDTTETDIIKLIDKKTLAYKWYWNIASSYDWTVFKIDWWFDYDPSIFVLYWWTYDNLINNESEWIQLLNNIQSSYSWTILEESPIFDSILWVEIDLLNPSKIVREIAYDLVNNQLDLDLPLELTSWPNWLTYDLSNSLLDNDTRSIAQDTSSNMWFATKNGVSTFIWNTWWSYAEADWLVNKDVRTVLQASAWEMWFATNKWISTLSGSVWTTYNKSDWLIDNDVVDLIQDSSWNFWFATKKWVSKYDGSSWHDYTTADGIANKIVTWITQSVWWDIRISTIDGVSKYDWVSWTTYDESDWLTNKNVNTIYSDTVWNIWFGTYDWVSKYDGATWTTYNEVDWLTDQFINDIYQDSDGNMWFATLNWASMYDGSTWKDYTIIDWLADKDVQVIFQDLDWNMWIGTKKWITIYFK
mgnify:CR=1 FL=1